MPLYVLDSTSHLIQRSLGQRESAPQTGFELDGSFCTDYPCVEWLDSRVLSMLDSGTEGPGSNRSRDAVG